VRALGVVAGDEQADTKGAAAPHLRAPLQLCGGGADRGGGDSEMKKGLKRCERKKEKGRQHNARR
jgi:hypothetical protein